MKKTILLLGVGIVVGAVTYAVLQNKKKQKTTVFVSADKKSVSVPADVPASTPDQETPVDEVMFAKKTAENFITERHEEAAQIIKEAVEVICKQSASSDNEREELDQIANGLDALLRED